MGCSRFANLERPTRFTLECQRILEARLAAKTAEQKADAEWMWEYLFHMSHSGRLEEYFASRAGEGE